MKTYGAQHETRMSPAIWADPVDRYFLEHSPDLCVFDILTVLSCCVRDVREWWLSLLSHISSNKFCMDLYL